MGAHDLHKQSKNNVISEDSVKQIKMLVVNSEEASANIILANQTLMKSINSITVGSGRIPDIVNNIQLLLVRSHLLSLDALTTSREARKSDSELASICDKLNILSEEIKEGLSHIEEASKNLITNSQQCSHIIEDSNEKLEITELSAQFVNHFLSNIENELDADMKPANNIPINQ